MSKIIRLGIAMLLSSIQAFSSDISEGEWVGGSDLFESPAYMHVDISMGNETKGTINIPQWKVVKRPLLKLNIQNDRIYFEIFSNTGVPFVAEGRFVDGHIEGTISRGDKKGKFHLISIKKVSSVILSKYVGSYQIPDPNNKGVLLPHLITYSANGHLRFVNLVDGSTSPLLPITEKKFFFAGSVMTSPVPLNTVSFSDGKFSIHIEGRPEMIGTTVSTINVEEITVQAKDHSLAGTLLLPTVGKKHPVVIVVPGSQGLNRDDNTPYEEINTFISNGFGLLIYDKPGTGQSGGDWQKSSYEQLAEDVLAFVEKLRSRKDIDRSKIGAWGFSQGATIAPLAASLSRDISYVIMQSGGGVTPAESEINQQVARMQVQKLSDTAIMEAIEFMKLQFKAVNDPQAWDSFQIKALSVKDKPWYRYTWGGLPKDHWIWKWWRPVVNHDPAAALHKVKVPVLVIFGTSDPLVPKDSIDGMISRITSALTIAGNKQVTVAKFQGANHEIFVQNEKKEFKLAPGYDETLKKFILMIKSR